MKIIREAPKVLIRVPLAGFGSTYLVDDGHGGFVFAIDRHRATRFDPRRAARVVRWLNAQRHRGERDCEIEAAGR